MTRARLREGHDFWLLTAVVSTLACGGRSSTLEQDEIGAIPVGELGGATVAGGRTTTSVAKGGTPATGGAVVMTGGRTTGGNTTGGIRNTGGNVSSGGRVVGGTGGVIGLAGKTGIGGNFTTSGGGSVALAGRGGGIGVGGGGIGLGGATGGSGGTVGTGGAARCNPSRTDGAAGANTVASAGQSSFAGAAGVGLGASSSEWFVDATIGADEGPGTLGQPLKTLACAAIAAKSGDTVSLLGGTWDSSIDPQLGNAMSTECGIDSGVAFAQNVRLRAVSPSGARIKVSGYHGICMNGGALEGIHFDCLVGRPAVETRQGALVITGSSWRSCGNFGLDIGGTAAVALRPGNLSDYAEGPNPQFAVLREQSALTVEGGTLSYQAMAFWAEGNAQLTLHGETIQSQDAPSMAGSAIYLPSGTPRLQVDGGTTFDYTSLCILGGTVTTEMTLDDVTFKNGANGIIVSQAPSTSIPKVSINRLTVTDMKSLGVNITGSGCDVSITNSSFTRVDSPAVLISGPGAVSINHVDFIAGWGAMLFSNSSAGLSVKVRNTTATGGQYSGVGLTADSNNTFDFGTLDSPGNNVFRNNNLSLQPDAANFSFYLSAGVVVKAVGNTWDANQQGADADGHYSVGTDLTALLVSSGTGPNYISNTGNAGQLLLAGRP